MEENKTSAPSSASKNNTMTVLTVVVVVVLLLLAGGVFAFRRQLKSALMPSSSQERAIVSSDNSAIAEPPSPLTQTNEAPANDMVAKELEVDYTVSGFTPKSITIKKGTLVKFVNKSEKLMSVASDPHPTHTNYPEFDQYKSTFKGQKEYDFTFDKVGTWGFHNHMNSSDGGTVVVTE